MYTTQCSREIRLTKHIKVNDLLKQQEGHRKVRTPLYGGFGSLAQEYSTHEVGLWTPFVQGLFYRRVLSLLSQIETSGVFSPDLPHAKSCACSRLTNKNKTPLMEARHTKGDGFVCAAAAAASSPCGPRAPGSSSTDVLLYPA